MPKLHLAHEGQLKSALKQHFDSFSTITDIFRPNVAIVMNWYADDYLDRDRPLQFERIGDHVNYPFDGLHSTHVFNTAHPRWMRGQRRSETIFKKWQSLSS